MNRGRIEGGEQRYQWELLNYRLTATPAEAGAILPTFCTVTARLLELSHECMDNGVWAHVLFEARRNRKGNLSSQNNVSSFTSA